ncbi:TetR/AcrR family transcriptional regulator [Agromyces protaetiae]|uniref:TetR/AcrR family transcriptional regulator n=1 Tax=Agromyces protaetiae TaxID=2509455 RepID=A0A4P6FE22_9MICO|nr:TetR family transcriptional regulator [Agromyces protaetiae]QAY72639.1 TetR/AcrR family transcriptional regulator [Agromyces protaetiae]
MRDILIIYNWTGKSSYGRLALVTSAPSARPRLTSRGAATRRLLIDGTAELIREEGVGVTLDDVLVKTRTSKSQIFHYFPGGKEELLLAVVQHEADRVLTDQEPHLDELGDWESWNAWRDALLARYREQGDSCPMRVVVSEIGRSPATQAVSSQLLGEWTRRLRLGITRLMEAGLIGDDVDADAHARALVAGIQGGVTVLLATGSIAYLESALDLAIENLRRFAREAS